MQQSSGTQAAGEGQADPPLPQRWQQSVENLEATLANLEQLTQALDGALFLDDDEWQRALPVHKYTIAVQVQHQRIQELEQQLARVRARLAESERGRTRAEARAKELNVELENNARVFQLHYDELNRKEKEISDLQAVVSALSLGGTGGGGDFSGGGSNLGAGGSLFFGGSDAGSVDGEAEELVEAVKEYVELERRGSQRP